MRKKLYTFLFIFVYIRTIILLYNLIISFDNYDCYLFRALSIIDNACACVIVALVFSASRISMAYCFCDATNCRDRKPVLHGIVSRRSVPGYVNVRWTVRATNSGWLTAREKKKLIAEEKDRAQSHRQSFCANRWNKLKRTSRYNAAAVCRTDARSHERECFQNICRAHGLLKIMALHPLWGTVTHSRM